MKERTVEDISWDIRCKREEMVLIAKHYGFTHELTIQYSQELDKLINEYMKVQSINSQRKMYFFVMRRYCRNFKNKVLKRIIM